MTDCSHAWGAGHAHSSFVLEPTMSLAPARTHAVKSLRCAPICFADGCAALDRVRFVAAVKVSAPEGCPPSCLTRGMQGASGPMEVGAMRFDERIGFTCHLWSSRVRRERRGADRACDDNMLRLYRQDAFASSVGFESSRSTEAVHSIVVPLFRASQLPRRPSERDA